MAVSGRRGIHTVPENLCERICRMQRVDAEVEEMLSGLYPGEDRKKRYEEYQKRKIKVMSAVAAIGIVSAVCLSGSSRTQSRLAEGTHLQRKEWGEGNYVVTLLASTVLGTEKFTYEVRERIFTRKELEALKEQALAEIPGLIAGENEDLANVRSDLALPSALAGYPFAVAWRSSDYERIRTDGRVETKGLAKQGEEVILTAVLSYKDARWEQDFYVRLFPESLDSEEKYRSVLEDLLMQNDEKSEKNRTIQLPEEVEGMAVTWKEERQDNSGLLLLLGIGAAALVSYGMKQDLGSKSRRRLEEISRLYPEFVCKLQLYMGAGMTVKNAFFKMGADYEKERGRTGNKRFLYEEILTSNCQLRNGIAQDTVYREWGRRCGEPHCRKLGFLLSAHLRQGEGGMLTLLSQETELAFDERRSRARKQGEEAGTRLLFPMLLMLIVVMFLILLPAFNGFGSI